MEILVKSNLSRRRCGSWNDRICWGQKGCFVDCSREYEQYRKDCYPRSKRDLATPISLVSLASNLSIRSPHETGYLRTTRKLDVARAHNADEEPPSIFLRRASFPSSSSSSSLTQRPLQLALASSPASSFLPLHVCTLQRSTLWYPTAVACMHAVATLLARTTEVNELWEGWTRAGILGICRSSPRQYFKFRKVWIFLSGSRSPLPIFTFSS